MDQRFGYVVGDVVANVALGALVGLLCWLIVGPSWNMWIAMFLMMAIGSILGLVSFFITARWLGAMEAMVPMMLTGELTGMIIGMAVPMMPPVSAMQGLVLGAACGAASMVIIWIANALLRGVTRDGREVQNG
ncbi:MAG: hypothetical protein FJX31_07320 [Alphaproteobacteria bacterium]|nr:hypothetical protein [Alphaproteobacteria bacterium]